MNISVFMDRKALRGQNNLFPGYFQVNSRPKGEWRHMGTKILRQKTCTDITKFKTMWASTKWSASVQFSLSVVSNSLQPHGLQHFPVHHQLLELTQTHVYRVGDAINHVILCHPLLLPPSIFPRIMVFSNESFLCIRWPKYWSFSFSISPSNEYSGLTSFRIDWFGLLSVQGNLKSLLQHHSSKASILRFSAFFIVQLSHPYMTTGKTTALTRWTFFGKVMSLIFKCYGLSQVTI